MKLPPPLPFFNLFFFWGWGYYFCCKSQIKKKEREGHIVVGRIRIMKIYFVLDIGLAYAIRKHWYITSVQEIVKFMTSPCNVLFFVYTCTICNENVSYKALDVRVCFSR